MGGRGQMKIQSIRFPDLDWELIDEAAQADGVSSSEWVRGACRLRLMLRSWLPRPRKD